MRKEDLRRIKILAREHNSIHPKDATGYFHKYVVNNSESEEKTMALIELEDGRMTEVYPTWIKFLDRQ